MALHLIKLCVGIESYEDFQNHISRRSASAISKGETYEPYHTTRMAPKRRDELLDGGSLYWVIKGQVQARQKLIDIRPFTDGEGINRCHLVFEPHLIQTIWQPRRAFQGWRYLKVADAPSDIDSNADDSQLPMDMQLELASLGLM